MPDEFLSDEQKNQYGRYCGDPNEAQLARILQNLPVN